MRSLCEQRAHFTLGICWEATHSSWEVGYLALNDGGGGLWDIFCQLCARKPQVVHRIGGVNTPSQVFGCQMNLMMAKIVERASLSRL